MAIETWDEIRTGWQVARAGLAFLAEGADTAGLERVLPPRPDCEVPLWLVTHVDLHRTAKVQAAAAALKRGLAS